MKKPCKDLKEHATRIMNYEKKKIIPLTKEEKINYNGQQICYICKKEFEKSDKKHHKQVSLIIKQRSLSLHR